MLLQSLLLLSSPSTLPLFHSPSSSPLLFLQKPTFFTHSNLHLRPVLAQSREPFTKSTLSSSSEENDPIELPQSYSSSSSPLQTATTVLLSGAIAAFLFRSIRRRAKRAKELRLRSSGTKESLKEKSLNKLKKMGSASIKKKSSTPFDALLGSLIAGVITVFLYKFAVTTEATLNSQTVSGNFSVRQITITIRTIVNGLCYLATFVYGFNSLGLFLYSGQLALSPFMDGSMIKENENKSEENAVEGTELTSTEEREDESRNGKQ